MKKAQRQCAAGLVLRLVRTHLLLIPRTDSRLPLRCFIRGCIASNVTLVVVAVILGQGVLLGDSRLLMYGGFIWLAFHVFVLAYEEPVLAESFGAQYEDFSANVPRWIPRLTPWRVLEPVSRKCLNLAPRVVRSQWPYYFDGSAYKVPATV